jgi:hypothetical protein
VTYYPEKIPNSLSPIKSFYYNLEHSKDVKSKIESKLSTLDERIEKIVEHFTLNDMPVIRFILNISDNKEELKNFSKALDRVADLIDIRNQLMPKLEVIKLAESEPNWFANTFGDFSVDVDLELDNFIFGESND